MIQEIIILEENTEILNIIINELGAQGLRGQSAYEYAITNGLFVGTEYDYVNNPIIAAENANQAASDVGTAVIDAESAAILANQNAILAGNAAQSANDAATLANQEAATATAAAIAANNSTTATNAAKDAANLAATNANAAKDAANSAASAANSAASAANSASTLANNAAVLANTKAGEANAAAGNANAAAANANAIANSKINKASNVAGQILRSNGTEFVPISEVEFMRNLAIYKKAPDSKFFDNKQLIAWDSFDRPNENPIIKSDSGHTYTPFKSANVGRIVSKLYTSISTGFQPPENGSLISITPTKNIGIEFSLKRTTFSGNSCGIALVKNDLNYFYFGRLFQSENSILPEIPVSFDYSLIVVINGVATVLGSISVASIYSGANNNDGFNGARTNFIIKYGNRGRDNASRLTVQSLDTPTQRLDVDVTNYNSTFETPSDYSKIALISNNESPIMSFKIANLNL